jgi:NADH dehydrogenase
MKKAVKNLVPESEFPRIVIIGGGFAGINLVKKLRGAPFQVLLIDKNNYHTFQPLLYQVATGGLEPDSIAFPLRKIFSGYRNFLFRVAEVHRVNPNEKTLDTNIGMIRYDHLVIATGSNNNFFGLEDISRNSMTLKSVPEALDLRSLILQNMEKALIDSANREAYMNFVVVGGGPTGVELAGALMELRKHVLPNDYPELDLDMARVWLIESGDRLLAGLSEDASEKAKAFLEKLGVTIMLDTRVKGYDGVKVSYGDNGEILSRAVIWAAGVKGQWIDGFADDVKGRSNRIIVDRYNRVTGHENIYALGDVALMSEGSYDSGHPMVAQVAIQQAVNLGRNLISGKPSTGWKKFTYRDLGSMATVGRNKAVADLPWFSTQGVVAWYIWMFIHLMNLVGFRNRVIVFINWLWNYVSYDRAIRLIIRPFIRSTS